LSTKAKTKFLYSVFKERLANPDGCRTISDRLEIRGCLSTPKNHFFQNDPESHKPLPEKPARVNPGPDPLTKTSAFSRTNTRLKPPDKPIEISQPLQKARLIPEDLKQKRSLVNQLNGSCREPEAKTSLESNARKR
jgi:hypothetical protein